MSSSTGKQYGLILTKKESQKISKSSVFDSGSDSEEGESIGRNMKKEFSKTQTKLKAQMEIQKVLDEDPTVYEYDSIYDSMKEKKEAKISEAVVDKKPKYIENLLKAAEKRKKEYERRVERKIQKEREEEGEKFADKEAFVTSAYKKKMQEFQEEEEKEKRMDVIEAMMDVTKQKDLSGFYRHLLNRETAKGENLPLVDKIKEEKPSSSDDERENNAEMHKSSTSRNSSSSRSTSHRVDDSKNKARECLRQLRKGSEVGNDSRPSKNTDTVDADSDFTSDSESSSDDSSDNEVKSKVSKINNDQSGDKDDDRKQRSPSSPIQSGRKELGGLSEKSPKKLEKSKGDSDSGSSESDNEVNSKNSENKNEGPVLSESDKLKALFAKRTVGDAFTAAQERYWERKRQRTSGLAVTCA